MDLLKRDDPRIADVIPGVMQDCDGRMFQHATTKDGKSATVEYVESDRYEISNGTFARNTKHVVRVFADGSSKVCEGWKS